MRTSLADLPWLRKPPDDFSIRCRELVSAREPGRDLQFLAGFRLSSRQASSLARSLSRCRAAQKDLSPLSPVRLGILASATAGLLLDDLVAGAIRHGVALELAAAPYNQVVQQAFDPSSAINRARPDAVLVAVDHRWLRLDRPMLTEDVAAGKSIGQLEEVVEALHENAGSSAILQTVPVPPLPLFGSFDRRVRGSVRAMVDEANRAIVALAERSGSYVLDVAALAEQIGTDAWFDPVQWCAYKQPFSTDCLPIYGDYAGRLLGAIRGKSRKALVLDLDNTIWGGVVGDDGVAGLILGQGDAQAEAFLAVQCCALELRERGVILAACSKNDDAVARAPFREHPDMLLKEQHFAIFQANWASKPDNLQAIAKALNIGLDALVFVDDNPAERAEVRAALPEIAVPELPEDPSWYPWYLRAAGYFEAIAFSPEDRLRAASYALNAQRAEVIAKSRDIGEYLSALDMRIFFSPFDTRGRQRIAQLINKTNQFNLTTRRYAEHEIAAMEADQSIFTLQVRLSDKYGDMGMIGTVICRLLENDHRTWEIDTWLMSCRVLGRQLERAILAKIVNEAAARRIERLVGIYIPTPKNSMVADHYPKLGFQRIGCDPDGKTRWEFTIAGYIAPELPFRVEDRFAQTRDKPLANELAVRSAAAFADRNKSPAN